MEGFETVMVAVIARADAALQRRGPHPLPGFLAMALRVTGGDRDRMAAVLAGVRAYQESKHKRPAAKSSVAARAGASRLLDHGGHGPPVVLVPSLINAPDVLDLAPGASLVEYLAENGFNPLVVDWGAPGPSEKPMSLDTIVTKRLLPLIAKLGEPAHLVGYCLGGTLAAAAAALSVPLSLALIATPWVFSGYREDRRAGMAHLWAEIAPTARASGIVPVDLLQPGFWDLDPERSVAKFERFGQLDPSLREARQYVLVEDWVNSGPPIGVGAAEHIFERLYRDDEPGSGAWKIDGTIIDPAALPCPVLNVVSSTDRIVPAQAAPVAGTRIDVAAGHVGMMVGSRARELLYAPLTAWLAG
jgi:polyhydroxyalkanoate synthase